MSVLAYLGTRLVMRVCTCAGADRRRRLRDRRADPAVHEPRRASSARVNDVAGAAPTQKTRRARVDKALYPDKGGYSHANTIGAVYYALTIAIYVYWGTYLSAEFKGGGPPQAPARRAMWARRHRQRCWSC